MIDTIELREAMEIIRLEDEAVEQAIQLQLKAESDARRITAQDYIATLDLSVDNKLTLAEQKTEVYRNMEFLKDEIQKATYGELKQELQKKIDELLIQANQLKDLQRAEK